MLLSILIMFVILFLLSLFVKINSIKKIKMINKILLLSFLLIFVYSTLNLYTWNIINLYNIIHIWNLENYFLLIFSILWMAVSFYTDFYFWEYLKHGKKLNYYYIFLLLFIFSMFGVIISSDAILFLIYWEIMSVSSYFLVIHEYNKKWILSDWAWYVIITHIWMFFIALSFFPFIQSTWSTNFLDWWNTTLSPILGSLAFFSALIWFWSKAGLFPIHIWLPKAHPIAPTNVSALMSWFMVKLPILMILKFLIVFVSMKVQFSWIIITLFIASISSFLWVFYAIIQHNIKKLLAYHTIENIGIIFLWISIAMFGMYLNNNTLILIWIFAALYHTFNHAIFKWLLFLVAWWIIERTWTYEYTKLWWLIKLYPFLAFAFLIWSIAIAWIVPLNWFNSEFLTYIWLIKSVILHSSEFSQIIFTLSVIILSATAVLSLICFAKVFSITFLWNQRDNKLTYKKIQSLSEKISYTILIVTIFILAILPWVIYFVISKILKLNYAWNIFTFGNLQLNYIPIYLVWILVILWFILFIIYKKITKDSKIIWVWNCWYPYIEPRTQYTSTSFIQPLRRIFATIYWEIKHIDPKKINEDSIKEYKKNLSHIEYHHNKKDFIMIYYQKILALIWYLGKKVKMLQNWQIQTYIFYMFLAVLITLSFVLLFK